MRFRGTAPALSITLLSAGVAAAQTPPLITTGGLPIGLETVVSGVTGPPLALDYAPDGTNRLFIAGQTTGRVELYKTGTAVQGTPFLNVMTGGVTLSSGSEKGLLGMAFHPNFNAAIGTPGRGKFYTYTSEPKAINDPNNPVDFSHPELGGVTGSGGDHDSVIREWTVNLAAPDTVDYSVVSRVLMRIREPQANHNAGCMRFGPDGDLYIALGDGGGANDNNSTFTDPTDGHTNNTGNGQDITNVYGKMLRIDPIDPDGAGPLKYSVPASNPFAGATPGVDEIFAYGLRNPWRFSFDRVGGGQYVADVGQAQREEIDLLSNGGNFGWVNMEGTRVNTTAISSIAPIGEYTHSDGQAVIGGYVYRGSNIPEMYGKYIFGELGVGSPSKGRLFYMNATGGTITEFTYAFNLPPGQLYSLGEDKDGELYALFANGTVARLLGRQWLATTGGSWNATGNWLGGIPNAAGASANFLGRISPSATITLDGSKVAGFVRFNNPTSGYNLAPGTGGTLIIDNGASPALIQIIRGSHAITAPLNVLSNTDLDIAAGSILTVSGPITVGSTRTITKKNPGTANISSIVGGSLSIQDGTVKVVASGSTSKLSTVAVTSGKLDLNDKKLIITAMPVGSWNGSSYTGVTGLIDSGRGSGGTWSGNGIVTSQSNAISPHVLTTLAVATASETGYAGGAFGGISVAASDVLVMYTWGGDANLDGTLNGDDYFQIDSHFNQSGMVFGYFNGDFNYDGWINGDDYFIIDSNWNTGSTSAPFPTSTFAGLAPVPEPTLVLAVPLFLFPRRRRPR